MAAFQVGAGLAKGLFPMVGPIGAATLRLLLGGGLLLVFVRPWRNWSWDAPLWALAVLGIGMAVTISLFYLAIERLPLGVTIALQFLGPLTIAVLGSRRIVDFTWAALAAAGVWYIVEPSGNVASLDPIGIMFALGAAIGWGSYILVGRVVGKSFGVSAAALSLSLAGLILLPFAILQSGATLLSVDVIPLAIAVALLSGAIPFSLELYALARLPARTFAVFTSLEPAIAALAGLLILGEVLAWSQLFGIALVVAAAAGAARSSVARSA
jgi:inner membrane transporter RhtA